MLPPEEYIEQAHFFRAMAERAQGGTATQELLDPVKEEILSTTKLPMAIDFLASELRLKGSFSTAMAKLPHYFTSFQTFAVAESEDDRQRFDLRVAWELLRREAEYRADSPSLQGIFLYEFECICRHRLGYHRGLDAIAADPEFDENWREWIQSLARQVGEVSLADLIYVRSADYASRQSQRTGDPLPEKPVLFGEKEGRIARANRRKDPLLLFAALHRQLGYPEVPLPPRVDESPQLLPRILRRLEQLEARIKLVEEEQRGGIDLTKFYGPEGARRFEAGEGDGPTL